MNNEDQTKQDHPSTFKASIDHIGKDGREAHTVEIDRSKVTTGEDAVFTCTLCGNDIHLIHDGEHFSLREEDANDVNFGTVSIIYINEKEGKEDGNVNSMG